VGTLANARGCAYDALTPIVPNSSRPAEAFFANIGKGDTPETNQCAKLAAEWVAEWLARMHAAFGPAPAPAAVLQGLDADLEATLEGDRP
jgi:hypothetical protein